MIRFFILNLHTNCNLDFAMSNIIKHNGVIECINGEHIRVRILQSSACSSCQAKSICSSSECKEKLIDVYCQNYSIYNIGENVNVCASEKMGRKAVVIAFVIPLIILCSCIFISTTLFKSNELIAIVIALLLLAIYYLCLSKNRTRISKDFAFWIERKQ